MNIRPLSILFTLLLSAQAPAATYTFTTYAGASSPGSADGDGTTARFFAPSKIAIDPAGNTFVSDTANHTIRRISTQGIVTTVAGLAGIAGNTDGIGSAARFRFPAGITVDAAGYIFVADSGNNAVRRIAPDGTVTSFVGRAGVFAQADATRPAYRFAQPVDITHDGRSTLFVVELMAQIVRRISPDGDDTVAAGVVNIPGTNDGPFGSARLKLPIALGLDPFGNLYIAEQNRKTLRKVLPNGTITTLEGLPTSAQPGNDGSLAPLGLVTDLAGTVYVAYANHTIHRITLAGVNETLAGQPFVPGSLDAIGAAAQFRSPTGLAIDFQGNVLVADRDNNTIRCIATDRSVTTVAGLGLEGASRQIDGDLGRARFGPLQGIAIDAQGVIYVSDPTHGAIRRIAPTGQVSTLTQAPEVYANLIGSSLIAPGKLAITSTGDLLAIESLVRPKVFQVTSTGNATRIFDIAASGYSISDICSTVGGGRYALVNQPADATKFLINLDAAPHY